MRYIRNVFKNSDFNNGIDVFIGDERISVDLRDVSLFTNYADEWGTRGGVQKLIKYLIDEQIVYRGYSITKKSIQEFIKLYGFGRISTFSL